MTLLIAALIGFVTFLNSATFLVNFFSHHPGTLYLGMVHHPQDYFYYLSQFTQGKYAWFWGHDLYTSDYPNATLVGWVNVFMGRLGSLVGISPIYTYQIAIAGFTILLFVVSYWYLQQVFPGAKNKFLWFMGLTLFAFSNAFPLMTQDKGITNLGFYTYWSNLGEPLARLGGVPHHLIANTMIVLSLLLTTILVTKKTVNCRTGGFWILLALSGFILASINPVQWAFTASVLGLGIIITIISSHKGKRWSQKEIIEPLLPVIVFGFGGLPMGLYLRDLFTKLPYLQLSQWEHSQQIRESLWWFTLSTGPLLILAIPAAVAYLRNGTLPQRLLMLYSLFSILLFLSPIPDKLGVMNVRMVSTITIFGLAVLGTQTIDSVAKRFKKWDRVIKIGTLVILLSIFLPVGWVQWKGRIDVREFSNSYYYLPEPMLEAYQAAEQASNPGDIFLVGWPMEITFPALTGRTSFLGHPLLTINQEEKIKEEYFFLDHRWSEEQMRNFLADRNITYGLFFNSNFPTPPSFLTRIYNNDMISVYKVTLEK